MPAAHPPFILLCDPDADSRSIYGAMLRHLGARVLEVEAASDALAVARREPVTAVVTEMLYLADGNSLVSALRADHRTASLPIYVVTAISPFRRRSRRPREPRHR